MKASNSSCSIEFPVSVVTQPVVYKSSVISLHIRDWQSVMLLYL